MRGWEWANDETGLGLFDRLHQAVMLLDWLLNPGVIPNDPLVGRAMFMRGRRLYWLGEEGTDIMKLLEVGEIWKHSSSPSG
jgi:hypothetical protein